MKRLLFSILGTVCMLGVANAVPVSGTILGPDNKPVAGAHVYVMDHPEGTSPLDKPRVQDLVTGEDGKFTAEVQPSGMRQRVPAIASAAVWLPNYALASMALQEGDNTVHMGPGGVTTGSVQDSAGKPVADATVDLTYFFDGEQQSYLALDWIPQLKQHYTAKSGADGTWRIDGLPPRGGIFLSLDDPRFVRDGAQVELSAVNHIAAFVATQGCIVTGNVQYEDGKPAAGVEVSTVRQDAQHLSAEATTDTNGNYRLMGVPAGNFGVSATSPSSEWVSKVVENVVANLDQPVQAPPISFDHGVVAEGTVVDADDNSPLAGMIVYVSKAGRGVMSAPSDAQGHFTVRVEPGTLQISPYQLPTGYVREPTDATTVTITPDNKTLAPFRLTKGLVLRGTALDEAGKPAVGAYLYPDGVWYGDKGTKVDAQGNWQMSGLPRTGEFTLAVQGAWQMANAQKITLPTAMIVAVVLRKLQLASLSGRVVFPDGGGVVGAVVRAQVINPPDIYSRQSKQTNTDANGHYSLNDLHRDAAITISASRSDSKYISGGTVQTAAGNFSASDIVMAPLTAAINGQVVDEAGVPVAGACVLSPDDPRGQIITTDARGRFSLGSLAAGDATVLAAKNFDWGKASAKAHLAASVGSTDADVIIHLAPGHTSLSGLGPVAAMVQQWVTAGNNTRDFVASQAVLEVAAVDPDRALELVTRDDGTATDEALSAIMQKVIDKDPLTAADWIPPRLPQIKSNQVQFEVMVKLGLAVRVTQPNLAKDLYRQAKATLNRSDFSVAGGYRFAELAGLAGALNQPEAGNLLQAAIIAVNRSSEPKALPDALVRIAVSAAPGGAAMVDQVLDELDGAHKMMALGEAIGQIKADNMPEAMAMLAKMRKLGSDQEKTLAPNQLPDPGQFLTHAEGEVAKVLAQTDTAAAAEMARDVPIYLRGDVLLAVAERAKGEAAKALYREAADCNKGQLSMELSAHIGALLYRDDPKLGEDYFASARAAIDKSRDDPNYAYLRQNAASYGYYRASVDPAGSRLFLEGELGAYQDPASDRGYPKWFRIARIAEAMVAIDPDRALEIATSSGQNPWFIQNTQANIVHYLLMPVADRWAVPFPAQ